MAKATVNDIEIEYEIWGEDGDPLLLISGLGSQLIKWSEAQIASFRDQGFRPIAYDNRDTGLSTKFDDWGPADIPAAFKQARAGETVAAPYNLEDMAADAIGLLDHLGIEKAHLFGSSNGGAIAQIIAMDYPDRTASLVSAISTSGRRGMAKPAPASAAWLNRPRNPAGTRDGAMDEAVETAGINGSPAYPRPEAELREEAARLYDRCFYPAGNSRHLLASIASADGRVPRLGEITAPTLVIHGRDDPLIPLECGEDIAKSIPGAELLVYDGMGHDFPEELLADMAAAVRRNADRGKARSAA